jgi:hypothetical protein
MVVTSEGGHAANHRSGWSEVLTVSRSMCKFTNATMSMATVVMCDVQDIFYLTGGEGRNEKTASITRVGQH